MPASSMCLDQHRWTSKQSGFTCWNIFLFCFSSIKYKQNAYVFLNIKSHHSFKYYLIIDYFCKLLKRLKNTLRLTHLTRIAIHRCNHMNWKGLLIMSLYGKFNFLASLINNKERFLSGILNSINDSWFQEHSLVSRAISIN